LGKEHNSYFFQTRKMSKISLHDQLGQFMNKPSLFINSSTLMYPWPHLQLGQSYQFIKPYVYFILIISH